MSQNNGPSKKWSDMTPQEQNTAIMEFEKQHSVIEILKRKILLLESMISNIKNRGKNFVSNAQRLNPFSRKRGGKKRRTSKRKTKRKKHRR
jgi:hypothetical protein